MMRFGNLNGLLLFLVYKINHTKRIEASTLANTCVIIIILFDQSLSKNGGRKFEQSRRRDGKSE
jgi:hypothetical protein